MNLILANTFICGSLGTLALLLCWWGWAHRSGTRAGVPIVGLGLSFAVYAGTPYAYWTRAEFPYLLPMALFGESFVPVFFWFTLSALFDDGFRWRPIHLLGALAAVASLVHVTWAAAHGVSTLMQTMESPTTLCNSCVPATL